MKPPTGAAAERESFQYQASRFTPVNCVVGADVLDSIALLYPQTEVPDIVKCYGTNKEQRAFDAAFIAAISNMDADKSPGAPWENLGQTNQLLANEHFDTLKSEVWRLFRFIMNYDLRGLGSMELFELTGIYYKMFVKSELHDVEKIKTGRQRLIYSSPITMTILERMFFGSQNDAEIDVADSIPSKPGMSFDREGALRLRDYCAKFKVWPSSRKRCANGINTGDLISTDMSGWDWHVQEWTTIADVEVRARCLTGELRHIALWRKAALNLNKIVMNKVVMFSDGQLWAQEEPGCWPSGSYRTSSTNSRMRVIVRYMIAADAAIVTMGDDAVEVMVDNLEDLYRNLGFLVKKVEAVDIGAFKFCSKWFKDGVIYPVIESVRKMILNLCMNDTEEVSFSISHELRELPDRAFYEGLGLINRH